ncbi:MAG: hypothetical protein H6556_11620 [Lewinellaceae bacterium]|nr:hypothetical protein [Lewinellaceae bacterium]
MLKIGSLILITNIRQDVGMLISAWPQAWWRTEKHSTRGLTDQLIAVFECQAVTCTSFPE